MAYTPNSNREIKNGKAVVSASELADFKKQYGSDMTLRDLLNADKGLERRGSKPNIPQVKPSVRNEVSPDTVKNLARTSGVKMSEEPAPAAPEPKKVSRVNEENTETSDFTFKKGGKVSSASRRGDGIAQRGKTRGKMC